MKRLNKEERRVKRNLREFVMDIKISGVYYVEKAEYAWNVVGAIFR